MCSLYLGDQIISGQATLVGESRNIGQIIPSAIPLTDAGLHLLDGSLINGNGIYSDFVDYIASIYNASASYFCTEAQWKTSVTTYGVCGKFVYDSTNNTVRLPKVTGIIEGTTDVTALGDLVEAGLPNITGGCFIEAVHDNFYGALYDNGGSSGWMGNNQNTSNGNIAFDASRSSAIYGNSTTVQPQTIKVLYYIVIATSTKTDIQVDIDEVVTDLNGKADVDLSNINASQSAKNEIVSWGMPDPTTKIVIPTGLFIPSKDGIVSIGGGNNGSGKEIFYGTNRSGIRLANAYVNSTTSTVIQYPVSKGENYFLTGSGVECYFIAYKGG